METKPPRRYQEVRQDLKRLNIGLAEVWSKVRSKVGGVKDPPREGPRFSAEEWLSKSYRLKDLWQEKHIEGELNGCCVFVTHGWLYQIIN